MSQKELANGSSYDGLCSEGKPHGFGKSLYGNGDVYEGQYRKGAKHGRGCLTSGDDLVFQGKFLDMTQSR